MQHNTPNTPTAEMYAAKLLPGKRIVSGKLLRRMRATQETRDYPKSQVLAYRLFWLTFVLFFASTAIGKLWDRVWHATHFFDTFLTPPHLFITFTTMLCGFLVATIAFIPSLRQWYGQPLRLPLIKWPMPGPLVILGTGLISLSIAIVLDNFWHTAYGLDETQWSMPHCMLGWCGVTIILGFVSARLAFRTYRPLDWITSLVIALLVLVFLCPAILGPFYLMYSPHLVHALATIPIVLTEPTAQHMYRIYLHYGLTRQTSPLFIPFASIFAGIATMFLRKFDARPRVFLLAPLLWSLTFMVRDLYTIYFLHYKGVKHIAQIIPVALHEPSLWVPIPLFLVALVYVVLRRTSFREDRMLVIAGFCFGIGTFLIWHSTPWMMLLAVPAAVLVAFGGWIGKWLYRSILEKPTVVTLAKFLLLVCMWIPAVLGVVDLLMRTTTK